MKIARMLAASLAKAWSVVAFFFRSFFPFGCGHWGRRFNSVDLGLRTLYLNKEAKRRRARCRKCTLAHLAAASTICAGCRGSIVPGDLVYFKSFSVSAVFPVEKGPVLICDTCRGNEHLAGRWSEHGLVRPKECSRVSGTPPPVAAHA